MKNLIKTLKFYLIGLVLISCDKDNMDDVGNWTLSPAVINVPSNNSEIILDENDQNETVNFSWSPAISSASYAITYSVVLDTLNSTNFDTPILELPSSNNGKGLSLGISNKTLDEYLSYSGYSANSNTNITWAVKAKCLDKISYITQNIKLKRFSTEIMPSKLYVSGSATENEDVLANAIEMKRLTNATGNLSNKFEIYTKLVSGKTYLFYSEKSLPCLKFGLNSAGEIVKNGAPINVPETAVYKVTIDLDNNTTSTLKINKWSMVGQVIQGGWSGDEPLEYKGGGVFKSSVSLVSSGNFVFRANGDWSVVLKKITSSTNKLVFESDAPSQGLTFQDIPSNFVGNYVVTLNLSAAGYTYSFELDTTIPTSITTPDKLFLFANGVVVDELTKSGDVYNSNKFIPFKTLVNYSLNSSASGLGVNYSITGILGSSNTPNGDKVTGSNNLINSSNPFAVSSDRALKLSINFSQAKLNWEYYNFKLFHWQIWDNRNEFVMTYEHPNKYVVTTNLTAGYDMKFISPWDYDFGSTTPSNATGNIEKSGGSNLVNITNSGSYKVTIILNSDYQTGTYSFVQQ
jgi:starch-binding outer membrane protein SusE/F